MSRAFRLGIFVVATLAVFAGGAFLIGSREFLFQSTYRLNADFPNVAGLQGGAEVRVGGIHKGTSAASICRVGPIRRYEWKWIWTKTLSA
jgi:hypothetical protein